MVSPSLSQSIEHAPAAVNEATGLLRGLATLPGLAMPGGPPRGDGGPVRVLPGYLTGDWSTVALRGYLTALGYDVRGWGLGTNRGHVARDAHNISRKVASDFNRTGRPVRLVGWSLGGVIGREVARGSANRVHQVVTLGSPIIQGDARSIKPRVTALYSKSDDVVNWKVCLDPDLANHTQHIEVRGKHSELGFSAPVLRLVAELLAEDPLP
jgi:pimeloyl-ACP methyl ester carboxylesterase